MIQQLLCIATWGQKREVACAPLEMEEIVKMVANTGTLGHEQTGANPTAVRECITFSLMTSMAPGHRFYHRNAF